MARNQINAAYYQRLHDTHPAFQANNWLTQDLAVLKRAGKGSLLELGCGNGRFLDTAADHWRKLVGVDWARSPQIDELLKKRPNVSFVQADILGWNPGERFDVVASADFLEHISTEALTPALRAFRSFGAHQFHRIACYDDGHSHLTIESPDWWLALFTEVFEGNVRLLSSEPRKGDPTKLVITIGSPVFAGS